MAADPVCKMALDEGKAEFNSEYKGTTYYFCGAGSRERFDKRPERYLSGNKVDWIKDE